MKEARFRYLAPLVALLAIAVNLRAWEYPGIWSEQRRMRSLTAEQLIDELDADNWIAGERLAEMGEAAVPALMAGLRDDDWRRRGRAASGAVWNAEATAPALMRHWATADADTADRTFAAFSDVHARVYVEWSPGPQPDLTDGELQARFWRITHATLLGAIANDDARVRKAAWDTAGRLNWERGGLDPEGAEPLVLWAWDEGPVRLATVLYMLPRKLPRAWLSRDEPRLRWIAAFTRPAEDVDILFEALRSDDPIASDLAARALAGIHPTEETIVPRLAAMVRIDGRPFRPAIAALDRIGNDAAAAMPELLAVAEDESVDHATRLLANDAAAKAGAPDDRTLPVVRAILKESNDDVVLDEADRQHGFYR